MKEERLGIALIVVQQVLFTLETGAIHTLGGVLTSEQIGLLRSAGGVLVALCLAPSIGWSIFRASKPWLQLLRSVSAFAYLWVMAFSFAHLPFADATAISYTQALYVVMFAPLVLGEVVGFRRYTAIAIGFVGALLIVKPGFSNLSALYGLVLAGTALNGLGLVLNKYLCRQDNRITVMLYVNLACLLGFAHGVSSPWPHINALPWAIAIVIAGPIGMYLGIVAVRHADASTVAPYLYVRLILATLTAVLLFGELPDALSICGAAVIVVGCVLADKSAVVAFRRLFRLSPVNCLSRRCSGCRQIWLKSLPSTEQGDAIKNGHLR